MKLYMLALTGLAFAISCSSPGGEQRVPAEDDLTPPLEWPGWTPAHPIAAVEHREQAPAAGGESTGTRRPSLLPRKHAGLRGKHRWILPSR